MKIVVMGSWADSLVNFRGPLLAELVRRGHEVTGCAPEPADDIAERLREIGAGYEQVKLQRTGMNPLSDARSIAGIKALLTRLKPDLLLGYTIKPVIYGSMAAKKAGIDSIFSIITGLGYAFQGETFAQRLTNIGVRRLYRKSLRTNRAVFFQNPDDMKLFVETEMVKPEQAVLINGSGVDLDHFNYTEPIVEPFSFLLIARLLREKGIKEYAGAARILREDYPDVKFRLLGPFDRNPSAIDKKTIDEWQDAGIIDYMGETEDVRPAIAAASVYVLPSYREGTPRSVLEAMSMGRPIISTDVPGCRETVVDGDNGFLVQARDSLSLAAAMKRFMDDPRIIAGMGQRSRELAVNKYDVHKVNAAILETMGVV
ncbi:MAG: glycosyltransferase family 4 protein [Thermoleophilia bacterium]|nr:glycosyltransferase family 4 protein [Thermoleophilia bacterium]